MGPDWAQRMSAGGAAGEGGAVRTSAATVNAASLRTRIQRLMRATGIPQRRRRPRRPARVRWGEGALPGTRGREGTPMRASQPPPRPILRTTDGRGRDAAALQRARARATKRRRSIAVLTLVAGRVKRGCGGRAAGPRHACRRHRGGWSRRALRAPRAGIPELPDHAVLELDLEVVGGPAAPPADLRLAAPVHDQTRSFEEWPRDAGLLQGPALLNR